MRVKDLQLYLSKFTEGNAGMQGNAVTNAVIYVEREGFLEQIRRIEVQEYLTDLFGAPSHRLVIKTERARKLIVPDRLKKDY